MCFLQHSDTTVDQHTFGIVLELGAELNRAGISTLTTWSGTRNFIATHGDNPGNPVRDLAWLMVWVRSERALHLATISAPIVLGPVPALQHTASPARLAWAALIASKRVGLSLPAPVLAVRAVHFDDPDADRGDVAGEARPVTAGPSTSTKATAPNPPPPAASRAGGCSRPGWPGTPRRRAACRWDPVRRLEGRQPMATCRVRVISCDGPSLQSELFQARRQSEICCASFVWRAAYGAVGRAQGTLPNITSDSTRTLPVIAATRSCHYHYVTIICDTSVTLARSYKKIG